MIGLVLLVFAFYDKAYGNASPDCFYLVAAAMMELLFEIIILGVLAACADKIIAYYRYKDRNKKSIGFLGGDE